MRKKKVMKKALKLGNIPVKKVKAEVKRKVNYIKSLQTYIDIIENAYDALNVLIKKIHIDPSTKRKLLNSRKCWRLFLDCLFHDVVDIKKGK